MDSRARWSDGSCGRGPQAALGGDAGSALLVGRALMAGTDSVDGTGA
jgi:hypothetical protein